MTVSSIAEDDFKHILEHGEGVWEALRGKSIFLTGATGFVGKWMLEALCRANDIYGLGVKATLLTRRPSAFMIEAPHLARHPAIELLEGDVRTFGADGLPSFDYIVHAATDVSADSSPAAHLDVFDVNLTGTRRVLDLARQGGCKGLLLTSSGAVYGSVPPDMSLTPETYLGGPDPMRLASAYGLGKKSSEWMATAYDSAYDIPVKIARIYALVGPYLAIDKHFAIGNFIKNKLASEPIVIQGDGTPFRSYLYAADLALWLWTILVKGKRAEAYNVGSDMPISLGDLAQRVASASGTVVPVHIRQTPSPATPAQQYAPDITKARDDLGLTVRVSLDDAIEKTLAWHRAGGTRAA